MYYFVCVCAHTQNYVDIGPHSSKYGVPLRCQHSMHKESLKLPEQSLATMILTTSSIYTLYTIISHSMKSGTLLWYFKKKCKLQNMFYFTPHWTGKTLSYAVPIVQSLQSRKLKIQRDDGPYALVIVPTREVIKWMFYVSICYSLTNSCLPICKCLCYSGIYVMFSPWLPICVLLSYSF